MTDRLQVPDLRNLTIAKVQKIIGMAHKEMKDVGSSRAAFCVGMVCGVASRLIQENFDLKRRLHEAEKDLKTCIERQ